jgi:hypothetical protein
MQSPVPSLAKTAFAGLLLAPDFVELGLALLFDLLHARHGC